MKVQLIEENKEKTMWKIPHISKTLEELFMLNKMKQKAQMLNGFSFVK